MKKRARRWRLRGCLSLSLPEALPVKSFLEKKIENVRKSLSY